MRRPRRATLSFTAMALGVAFAVLFMACGSSGTGAASRGGADASLADTAATQTYGASACEICIAQACATTVQACEQDPQCTLYLSCLDACATADGGDVSASCAAACPLPDESTGQAAQQAFAMCRTESAPSCEACGAPSPEDGGADASTDGSTADAEGGAHDADVDSAPNACQKPDASSCEACVQASCCPETLACTSSADCLDFVDCRNACKLTGSAQEACWYDCDQKYSDSGVQGFANFNACATLSCSAPAACDYSCANCAITNCATEYAQCYENADCFQSIDCFLSCTGADAGGCQTACAAAFPDAGTLLNNYETCYGSKCPGACNVAQVRPAW